MSLWGVYSETFIHHYDIPLAHSFTCFVWFFPSHVHPALCLFPLVTVCTVFVFRLFTIKHFGASADFQISWTMEEGVSFYHFFVCFLSGFLFVCLFLYILIHLFAINITWFVCLVLTFPQLCCFIPNKTSTTVKIYKRVWMSKYYSSRWKVDTGIQGSW